MDTKKCTKCEQVKPLDCFHRRADTDKVKYRSHCKECSYNSLPEQKKEAIRKRQRRWAKENPDKVKQFAEKDKENRRRRENEKYRTDEAYRAKRLAQSAKHWRRDPERNSRTAKLWRLKNAGYDKAKYRTDEMFRLKKCLRGRIKAAYKDHRYARNKSTQELLGCSIDHFKEHIAKQFKPGMSWENHGEWHIDHVVPLASAKTEEELRALCHYTNLQPLWRIENISKGAKLFEQWQKTA